MNGGISSRILRTLSLADPAMLARSLRANLGGRRLALCFHRVGAAKDKLWMPATEIDRLIGFLVDAAGALTVCFDDGYRDGAEYVLSRAPRHAQIEWLFFVCPQKTEAHDEPDLAELELCRAIGQLPNAALGNHTNLHQRPTLLLREQSREEFARSMRDFQRLFGAQRHFAIPFGVPHADFAGEHVEQLRALGDFLIWSTEPRPFHARERRPGALLPRFAVDGTRTWKETAVHIALHALRSRIAGEVRP